MINSKTRKIIVSESQLTKLKDKLLLFNEQLKPTSVKNNVVIDGPFIDNDNFSNKIIGINNTYDDPNSTTKEVKWVITNNNKTPLIINNVDELSSGLKDVGMVLSDWTKTPIKTNQNGVIIFKIDPTPNCGKSSLVSKKIPVSTSNGDFNLSIKFDRNYSAEYINYCKQLKIDAQHNVNMVLEVATSFFPPLSAAIGLYDASLYWEEGDKKNAGLAVMFAFLPGVLKITQKIPGIKQLGSKGLNKLSNSIIKGTKLTPKEKSVLAGLVMNKQLVKSELLNFVKTNKVLASNIAKNTLKGLTTTGKLSGAAIKSIAPYVGAAYAYEKTYSKLSPRIKDKVESEGFDWDYVKKIFQSSGSKEDNQLLSSAWDNGWRPGDLVPSKYETKSYTQYKTNQNKAIEDLNKFINEL